MNMPISLEEIAKKYMRAFPEKFTKLVVEDLRGEEKFDLHKAIHRDRQDLMNLNPEKYA